MLQKIDISDKHLEIVKDILQKYPYDFYVFGSRAKQVAKKFSDLDLCYFDNIDSKILLNLEEDFEESDLPYKVDIINFHSCDKDFQDIIMKDMVFLQRDEKPQELEETLSPSSKDIEFLTEQINKETADKGSSYQFAFFMRDKDDNIISGCNGFVIYGVIYIDQLWVSVEHRKQGLGTKLMERVHEFGRRIGCIMTTVTTMSFQGAKEFYENLGYICDFERQGYINNSKCIFLKKIL